MKHYLLTIQQPIGGTPEPAVLQKVMREVGEIIAEAKERGAWVYNGGLHAPDTATVLRPRDGEVLVTDGPYAEGKEHVGGLVVVRAPDLDAALGWGRKLARAIGLPIEVRPFQGDVA